MNVASMAANMADTFFWKHDDEVERQCKMEINVMKGFLSALMVIATVVAPFISSGILAADAAMSAEAAAVASETLAADSAVAAVAAEEAVLTAEKAVVRGPAAVGGNPLSSPEREAAVAEWKRLGQVATDARTRAVTYRTEATRLMQIVEKRKLQRYLVKPAPWTFSRIVRGGKIFVSKYTTGVYSSIPNAFMGLPMIVSCLLSNFVAHAPFDPMVVPRPNVSGIDRRYRR